MHKTQVASNRLVGAGDLSAILNQLSIGLAEIDLDGRVVSANERFCALIGRSPESVLVEGLSLGDVFHPSDAAMFDAAIRQLADGLGAFSQDVRVMADGGRPRWVEVSAAPLSGTDERPASAALTLTDASRRKAIELRASETERRFHQVADAAPLFIWMSGMDRRRRHTWVNQHWSEFRGRPMEAELGQGWTPGVHPDDAAECLRVYSAAFDRRQPFTAEYRLRRYDGEYRWVLDTGRPIYDDHGQFIGYIGTSVDISERKTAEREREALLAAEQSARSEAERANQLKDEFLSILSHELRTPLNAVLGWVHLMRTSGSVDPHLERGLTVIERNARLQSRMVDDLLDMGGVMAGKMRVEARAVPIDRVIEGATESLQPAFIEKDVSLRRVIPDHDWTVKGDPNRLHQIVWNLLSNALKFSPAGGEVAIELRRADGDVEIVVRDRGEGIDPAFLPFVFERFRQGDPSTRRSHGGLGIGLALVKSLAELHGGRVRVDSPGRGGGATFVVALPLIARSSAVHASATPDGTRLESAYGG